MMSRIWPYIALFLGVLAVVAEFLRRGRKLNRQRNLLDDFRKDKEGRNAVAKEQAETDGLSSRDLVDRMRRRDGDFGGI